MAKYEGKVLNGRGELVGWGLETAEDGSIVELLPVGEGEGPKGWVIPGLIDIHCHGGGGASFPDSWEESDVATAIDAHRKLGTTGMMASLVSMLDPIPQIELLVPACERGELLGIHLEGPYISIEKKGAQNPDAVRAPDLDELRRWLEAGKGWIKTMTIAPEVPRAQEAAELLLEYGALPSWGHTSATMVQTRDRVREFWAHAQEVKYEGVCQTATHLFNGMPEMLHREPGPVRELVQTARRGEAVVELIGDGIHVNLDLVADVVKYVQNGDDEGLGLVFVTDSMAAAGLEDGAYELGGLPVTVKDGVARLTEGGAIAGGTSRLIQQIQGTVRAGLLEIGEAVKASVAAPARVLGLDNSASGVTLEFVAGEQPNLLHLDEELNLLAVVREGKLV